MKSPSISGTRLEEPRFSRRANAPKDIPSAALHASMIAVGAMLMFDVLSAPQRIAEDFRSFYLAGWAARLGLDVYDPASLREIGALLGVETPIHPYLYPPTLAYLGMALTLLTPVAAQITWWMLGLGLIAPALTLVAIKLASPGDGEGSGGGLKLSVAFVVAAFLLWMFNIRSNMWWGQVNPIVVALILLALTAHLKKNASACGALLGAAAVIKITPALLLLYFGADRALRRQVLTGFLAAAGLGFLVTLPLGGLPAWGAFVEQLPGMSHGSIIPGLFPASSPANFSLAGFFARLTGDETLATRALTYAAVLALLAPVLLAMWRARRAPNTFRLLLAPLSIVMVLGSPLAYAHHVLYLLPGTLLQLAHTVRSDQARQSAVLLVLFTLVGTDFPAYYYRFNGIGPVGALIFTSLNLYALLALYVAGMRIARSAIALEAEASPADSERPIEALAASS